ncbi:MAG: VCBS repeat-containing protein [Pirellulales bacterium]|nr:VCBS repeat-containing protein [Pirellulales bacterium]
MMTRLNQLSRAILFCIPAIPLFAAEPASPWRTQEIETQLTIGYAVSLCDVNADAQTDIVVVDADRVVWYENPTWKRRTIIAAGQTERDNVCIAPADIDADGQLDFALGAAWRPADTSTGGTLQWLRRGKTLDDPWDVLSIGSEPTMHRMRFADFDNDGQPELYCAPLLGRGTTKPHFAESGVRILRYKIPANPGKDPWVPEVINETLHVTHNLWPCDVNRDGKLEMLLVSFEGVHQLTPTASGSWQVEKLGAGNQDTTPNKGASEVKLGRLNNESNYIATIEPWHGFQVVVYTPPSKAGELWQRNVIDEQLLWGHAVWCANLDDDPAEELVIGVRDQQSEQFRSGIRIYDPTPDPQQPGGTAWRRQIVDPGGVAVEDAAAADLNGDGRVDIVACGRATKNVRIYWNEAGANKDAAGK